MYNPAADRGHWKWPDTFGYFLRPPVCEDGHETMRSVNFVDTTVKRGEIYYADLSPVVGSEQGGRQGTLEVA